MKNSEQTKALYAAALQVVYTDFDKYVEDSAREHAISNAGMTVHEHLQYASDDPARAINAAWNDFLTMHEEESYEGAIDELKMWRKEMKRACGAVKKSKKAWTLANAFEEWRVGFKKKLSTKTGS